MSLDAELKASEDDYRCCSEKNTLHGDIAVVKNWPGAHSITTTIKEASKDHFMVAVNAPMIRLQTKTPCSAAKPAFPLSPSKDPPEANSSRSSAAKSATPLLSPPLSRKRRKLLSSSGREMKHGRICAEADASIIAT